MKLISAAEAARKIKDGAKIMIGGFMAVGTPNTVIGEIVTRGTKNLTLIANDAGFPDVGTGKLIRAGLVKKLITTHIGMNPELGQKMIAGEVDVELIPQGTFAECIRCAGSGLGGFLTPTGVGTEAAEGKRVIAVDGRDYLLETPMKAEIAVIKASVADESGNLLYYGTTRNFNPIMAIAAEIVIAEAETIVKTGEIDPNHVMTPGLFVDFIVKARSAARF